MSRGELRKNLPTVTKQATDGDDSDGTKFRIQRFVALYGVSTRRRQYGTRCTDGTTHRSKQLLLGRRTLRAPKLSNERRNIHASNPRSAGRVQKNKNKYSVKHIIFFDPNNNPTNMKVGTSSSSTLLLLLLLAVALLTNLASATTHNGRFLPGHEKDEGKDEDCWYDPSAVPSSALLPRRF